MTHDDFDEIPYRSMGRFLQQRFGRKVFKIGVDAGFSCPHRGSDRQRGGCSFCSPDGSRSPLVGNSDSIRQQIHTNADYWRQRYPDCGLLLYFQAYTSTMAPVDALREIYQSGLRAGEGGGKPFAGMVVGTRPDCLPDAVIELLASLRTPEREVWVELGLQSAHESSLIRLNRGHSVDAYRDAAARLAAAGIPVIPHLIFGIPGEGPAERHYTLEYIQRNTPSMIGVKMHNLVLLPGTPLHRQWKRGEIAAFTLEQHLEATADAITRLSPELAVMRLTADTPRNDWPTTVFTGRLQQLMRARGWYQGCRLESRAE